MRMNLIWSCGSSICCASLNHWFPCTTREHAWASGYHKWCELMNVYLNEILNEICWLHKVIVSLHLNKPLNSYSIHRRQRVWLWHSWHWRDSNRSDFIKSILFCVLKINKVLQVWNETWVSKRWQNVNFII